MDAAHKGTIDRREMAKALKSFKVPHCLARNGPPHAHRHAQLRSSDCPSHQAAGLERRMSHISHSVEKAEREQRLVERLIERRTLSASAASSAPPSLRGAGSPRRALTASQATELS
jgi:hypothetical protein